jgi:DNA-directed RNA polymerase alpha subunit
MDNPIQFTVDTPIEEMEFPVRIYNRLKRAGIENIGGILALTPADLERLRGQRNFLIDCVDYIRDELIRHGVDIENTEFRYISERQ